MIWFNLKYFIISILISCLTVVQASASENNAKKIIDQFLISPNDFVQNHVAEQYTFYGLASYYNQISIKVVSETGIDLVTTGSDLQLKDEEWLVVIGRVNVLAIKSPGLEFDVSEQSIYFKDLQQLKTARIEFTTKNQLKFIAKELDKVRYSHLTFMINILSRLVEAILNFAFSVIGNWGVAIILLGIFLKVILTPVSSLVRKYQDQVSKIRSELEPRLAIIKQNYKGEEAHKRFVKAHKDMGVSTFYSLKPMLGLLVQIPIWIAVFNALAEMPQISKQSFLWIEDFAYPDALVSWDKAIPLIGSSLNLLPLIMTGVTLFSSYYFRDKFSSEKQIRAQKRNLTFMAIAFLILFFPFPSGMVFYWTIANILNALPQIYTILKPKKL